MRDLYMRHENDPTYVPDRLEVNDEIEALVYQAKMTINTNKGEVLGEIEFGCNMEELLFSTNVYAMSFGSVLTNQIMQYSEYARIYPVRVNVKQLDDGVGRSTVLLDVMITERSVFGILME